MSRAGILPAQFQLRNVRTGALIGGRRGDAEHMQAHEAGIVEVPLPGTDVPKKVGACWWSCGPSACSLFACCLTVFHNAMFARSASPDLIRRLQAPHSDRVFDGRCAPWFSHDGRTLYWAT